MQSTKNRQTCFIDLRKAFDSLDHSQLLTKLYNYGFRGPIFHLMSDYLTNRWRYVFDNERITEKLAEYRKNLQTILLCCNPENKTC